MPSAAIQPTPPPQAPARGVKAATFKLLVDTAMAMIGHDGNIPSVAQVAVRSAVSRATAYRYFPTRSALITAVIGWSLGPVRTFASDTASGRERVRELFLQTFPRFTEFEPQLRAAAQLALEQGALERAGLLEEEPYRRGHRVRILEHALAPMAPTLPRAVHERLHRALSVVYGIEPYIILKDIWGLPDREVERLALWMADALIDAALRDVGQLAGRHDAQACATGAAGARGLPAALNEVNAAASVSAASVPAASKQPKGPASRPARMSRVAKAQWLDEQYNNRARIPEHPTILQTWLEDSARARATLSCQLDLPYGGAASETLDVFAPAGARNAPVLVYIHGGYWRALDKRDQSFVATPFVRAGAVVVLPNYALAPAVSVRHIVLQMVQAVAWVARHIGQHGGDTRRIVVAGHSAGGHLAAMMLACRWQEVGDDLPEQLVHTALSISGVFDLEPLRHAPFLAEDLKLSANEARQLSPAHMPAPATGRLLTVVGGDESEEFLRQNQLIARCWGRERVPVCQTIPGRHHMNVLFDLADPGCELHALALQALGLALPGASDPGAAAGFKAAR